MGAWITLFSKFSSEFLLFEALSIFVLAGALSVMLILRRKRFPESTVVVPAQVFRDSLNQLIGEAETLKSQLFGGGGGVPTKTRPAASAPPQASAVQTPAPTAGQAAGLVASVANASQAAAAPTPSGDSSALQTQLSNLEQRVSAQTQQIATLNQEKQTLTDELSKLKNDPNAAKNTAANANPDSELLKKIRVLEEKLEEYSVIEDDLANLKRLQQENAQLKAKLGVGATEAVAAPATSATAAGAPAPAPEPVPPPAQASTPEPAPAPVAAAPTPTAPAGASPTPDAKPPAAAQGSTTAETAATLPNNDNDLLAEFEKILNS